jgi:hypothetical protein
MFLDLADLDRDSRLDVLVPTFARKLHYLRRTASVPPAWEARLLPFPELPGTGKAVRVADIDLDGKSDVVLTLGEGQPDRGGVFWLAATGGVNDANWRTHSISGPPGKGFKPDLIEPLDLDGDGDLDVITTEERGGLGVIWYENPTK